MSAPLYTLCDKAAVFLASSGGGAYLSTGLIFVKILIQWVPGTFRGDKAAGA